MSTIKQVTPTKESVSIGKQRNYNEVVEFFEKHWSLAQDGKNLDRMQKLNKLFNNSAQKLKTILIAGTNGKSLTAHFTGKLLKREGLVVGMLVSPHILTYNERFMCDNEAIPNRTFTELANEVINMAENAGIEASTQELLTQLALNYFVSQNVDVAILEVERSALTDPAALCNPSVLGITRLVDSHSDSNGTLSAVVLKTYADLAKKDTMVVSADQNKSNLKLLSELVETTGGKWSMPIRKLVPLTYPFEQLHGRCAALAERIATLFMNKIANKETLLVAESLLTKEKGKRGRPTLEAKRELELNPKKTIEQFWKEVLSDLPGRFQLLEKEKPTILLDTASNIDAFENFLLGIRLMHYQRPLKGLALIISCEEGSVDPELFAKQIRYFFKKTAGHIILCPLGKTAGWQKASWNLETINNALKSVKIKSRTTGSFKEAFDTAKKLVNDRHGLIGIAGSTGVLHEYWIYKGIKKVS